MNMQTDTMPISGEFNLKIIMKETTDLLILL